MKQYPFLSSLCDILNVLTLRGHPGTFPAVQWLRLRASTGVRVWFYMPRDNQTHMPQLKRPLAATKTAKNKLKKEVIHLDDGRSKLLRTWK